MGTHIEWTDEVWNPVSGCDRVSAGCDHCYALTFAKRLKGMGVRGYDRDGDTSTSGPGFGVSLHPWALDLPLRWRKPRRVFVNSMSDLFHEEIPDEYIARVFAVMASASRHTFQVLTKRHARMRSLLRSDRFFEFLRLAIIEQDRPAIVTWPLPNVWLGVSVENQQWADIRIPALLDTPAAVRFLSCEPLLGPVDLAAVPRPACTCGERPIKVKGEHVLSVHRTGCPALRYSWPDWVIVGGESGHGARPMHQEWARSLRDQCTAAGVPFLFKQWGEWAPQATVAIGLVEKNEHHGEVVPDEKYPDHRWRRVYRRVGKKAAGRVLDGRTWDEFPEAVTV